MSIRRWKFCASLHQKLVSAALEPFATWEALSESSYYIFIVILRKKRLFIVVIIKIVIFITFIRLFLNLDGYCRSRYRI